MIAHRATFWGPFAVGAIASAVAGWPPTWASAGASLAFTAVASAAASVVLERAAHRATTRRLARLVQMAASLDVPRVRSAGGAPPSQDDDHDLDRVERSLTDLARSLEALLARERSFTRYASHELRTPVSALKLQLERVQLGQAQADEILPSVVRQVARIEELIDALLALARARGASSGGTRSLEAVITDVLEPLPDEQRRRVYLVPPVPKDEIRDAVLVRQALRNLVENGLRHGSGPVTVSFDLDGDTFTARVRDMGPGIPAAELRRLADGAALRVPSPEGHGLGLTLVQLIARALGGRLLLHNTETGLEASLTVQVLEP